MIFFSPSGGLTYHLRALQARGSLWLPFIQNLDSELKNRTQKCSSSHLVLVGGSGGHCLTTSFLEHFESIIHIDKDPLAAFFFKRRHKNLKVRFLRSNIFNSNQKIKAEFINEFPSENHIWLWSNLLGQLGLENIEDKVLKTFENINSQMSGYRWLSYHDVYSAEGFTHDAQLRKRPYSGWDDVLKSLEISNEKIVLRDHLTKDHLNLKDKKILPWALRENQLHFVEVGSNGF
ncbi:MAG TPA: hypothetical protein DCL41_07285 [Bdellovibrionales bacterium]|nr:hypothetical protein [Pseudobdellovibrionaceae bacterium]HAG91658.1 hypothetical protein [Bdellovibrionales bacterium]